MNSSTANTLIATGAALMIAPLLLSYQHSGGPPAALLTETGIGYSWFCFGGGVISMIIGVVSACGAPVHVDEQRD